MDIFSLIMLGALVAAIFVFWQERSLGIVPMPVMPQMARLMLEECPERVNGDILEIGSGWGGLAIKLARKYPDSRVVGCEMSWVPYLFSHARLKAGRLPNLNLLRKDFFDVDFSGAGLVVCYLSNAHMKKLEPKFLRELPEGAKVVSSTFACPEWQPVRVRRVPRLYDAQIFVYEVKRAS